MKLLLMRHGIAEDHPNDDLRALTSEGVQKAKKVVGFVKNTVADLSLIVTSPLVRAKQTGAIFSEYYNDLEFEESTELRPECAPSESLISLNQIKGKHSCIAVIGHQPHISYFASFLLTGNSGSGNVISFGRATACLIEFASDYIIPGQGSVEFLVKPKLL